MEGKEVDLHGARQILASHRTVREVIGQTELGRNVDELGAALAANEPP
jgi:hypothetical protein